MTQPRETKKDEAPSLVKLLKIKDLSQLRDLSAFKGILDSSSKSAGADWSEQNFFSIFFKMLKIYLF